MALAMLCNVWKLNHWWDICLTIQTLLVWHVLMNQSFGKVQKGMRWSNKFGSKPKNIMFTLWSFYLTMWPIKFTKFICMLCCIDIYSYNNKTIYYCKSLIKATTYSLEYWKNDQLRSSNQSLHARGLRTKSKMY